MSNTPQCPSCNLAEAKALLQRHPALVLRRRVSDVGYAIAEGVLGYAASKHWVERGNDLVASTRLRAIIPPAVAEELLSDDSLLRPSVDESGCFIQVRYDMDKHRAFLPPPDETIPYIEDEGDLFKFLSRHPALILDCEVNESPDQVWTIEEGVLSDYPGDDLMTGGIVRARAGGKAVDAVLKNGFLRKSRYQCSVLIQTEYDPTIHSPFLPALRSAVDPVYAVLRDESSVLVSTTENPLFSSAGNDDNDSAELGCRELILAGAKALLIERGLAPSLAAQRAELVLSELEQAGLCRA